MAYQPDVACILEVSASNSSKKTSNTGSGRLRAHSGSSRQISGYRLAYATILSFLPSSISSLTNHPNIDSVQLKNKVNGVT